MVINHNLFNAENWLRIILLWAALVCHINAAVAVNVYTREGGMSESNASKPYIYIQNTGSEVLSNFVYYYYFQTESSQVPVLDKYYLPSCETVILEPVASGYRLKYTVTGANLSPGGIHPNSGGNSVALHYNGWTAWDKTNDFSNNFSSTFQANNKIAVYVGGTRIFGSEPDTASTPPSSPDSLNLTAMSWQRIDLSWVDNSNNESGFRIERAIGSDSFIEIGTTDANFTTYQSTGLTANTTYTYRVRAYNIAGNSDYCTSASATTLPGPAGYISRDMWTGVTGITVSSIPLSTTPDISNTINILETASNYGNNYGQRIRGYITAPSNGQYTFWISSDDNSELWLSTNNQPSNKVKIASVTGYTNSREWSKYTSQKSSAVNLLEGSNYYIEILHKEGDQNDNLAVGWLKPGQSGSVPSEVVPGYVLSPYIDTTVPDDPTGLYANSIYSTQVGLSWIDNSSNENGFKIERAQGAGPFSEIAVVPINSTTYLDNGLTASTEYHYRVLAYNSAGNSAYSNTLTCTTTVTSGPGTAMPVSLLSFAIYSSEQSLIKDRSVFSGGGAVGSNGYVEVGSNANVQGNLVSGGNIYLRNYAKVYGNVSANGTVTFQAGAEIFDGTWQDSASNAVVNFPVIPPINNWNKRYKCIAGTGCGAFARNV